MGDGIVLLHETTRTPYSVRTVEEALQHLIMKGARLKNNDEAVRRRLCSSTELFLLYDARVRSLMLVEKADVEIRVKYADNRLLTPAFAQIIRDIAKEINDMSKQTAYYYRAFQCRRDRNVAFLEYVDYPTLAKTFWSVFDESSLMDGLTCCLRPSFMFYQYHMQAFYSQKELEIMANNRGLKRDDAGMQCELVQRSDFTSDMLMQHLLYINENKARWYILYYTFIGSDIFNRYMRGWDDMRDPKIERHITNFWHLLDRAPALDRDCIVYRFIRQDDHLALLLPGDTVEEKAFMSTRRDPFYEAHGFGLVLMKIHLPADLAGVALCIESTSKLWEENEVVVSPCVLRLRTVDTFTYRHYDSKREDSNIRTYEFDFVRPLKDVKEALKALKYRPYDRKTVHLDDIRPVGSTVQERASSLFEQCAKLNTKRVVTARIQGREARLVVREFKRGQYGKFLYFNQPRFDGACDTIYYMYEVDDDTAEPTITLELAHAISCNWSSSGNDEFSDASLVDFIKLLARKLECSTAYIHSRHVPFDTIPSRLFMIDYHGQACYRSDRAVDRNFMNMMSVDQYVDLDLVSGLKGEQRFDKTMRASFDVAEFRRRVLEIDVDAYEQGLQQIRVHADKDLSHPRVRRVLWHDLAIVRDIFNHWRRHSKKANMVEFLLYVLSSYPFIAHLAFAVAGQILYGPTFLDVASVADGISYEFNPLQEERNDQ